MQAKHTDTLAPTHNDGTARRRRLCAPGGADRQELDKLLAHCRVNGGLLQELGHQVRQLWEEGAGGRGRAGNGRIRTGDGKDPSAASAST